MKELPILFSTPMVQAIMEGKKNQTRRTKGLEKVNQCPDNWTICIGDFTAKGILFFNTNGFSDRMKPRYQKGDHMWVRETFYNGPELCVTYLYKAEFSEEDLLTRPSFIKWKPSLFMPKGAARIWVECTGVKCDRLHNISKQDAINEGVEQIDKELPFEMYRNYQDDNSTLAFPAHSFFSLWRKINGNDSVSLNPWVFIYDFKRIEK